jgi:hypothetical protein
MKILRLAVLALAAFAFADLAIAASPTIPAEYRGEWCTDKNGPYYFRARESDEEVTCFKITARRLSGEWECDVVSVTPLGHGHNINFKCTFVSGKKRTEPVAIFIFATKEKEPRIYIEDAFRTVKKVIPWIRTE